MTNGQKVIAIIMIWMIVVIGLSIMTVMNIVDSVAGFTLWFGGIIIAIGIACIKIKKE